MRAQAFAPCLGAPNLEFVRLKINGRLTMGLDVSFRAGVLFAGGDIGSILDGRCRPLEVLRNH